MAIFGCNFVRFFRHRNPAMAPKSNEQLNTFEK